MHAYLIQKKEKTDNRIKEALRSEHYQVIDGLEKRRNEKDTLLVQCPRGHKFETNWEYWRQKHRCPECRFKSLRLPLEQIRNSIESEGYTVDISELKKRRNSFDKFLVRCPEGHEFRTIWANWSAGRRCPYCAVIKKSADNRLPAELIVNAIRSEKYRLVDPLILENRKNNKDRFKIECPKGHLFETCWNYWQKGNRCPTCFRRQSNPERVLLEMYAYLGPKEGDRVIIKPKELDIYFPTHNVAIEYCGLYWHGDQHERITSNYHRAKLDACTKQKIRLLTIFEDEWKKNKEICLSRINNALHLIENRIPARLCNGREITKSEAKEFLTKTHLQGPGTCRVAYGLFYNDELVQVMTFGVPARFHTSKGKRVLEMKRLASKINVIIIGGAGKLFKMGLGYAQQNGYETVKSYCDLRWGTGGLYKELGFTLTSETKWTPHYTDGISRWRNQSFAQNKHKTMVTELEKTRLIGLWKVYDCGHQTWEYRVR